MWSSLCILRRDCYIRIWKVAKERGRRETDSTRNIVLLAMWLGILSFFC